MGLCTIIFKNERWSYFQRGGKLRIPFYMVLDLILEFLISKVMSALL